jgi:hypothetical protein
MKMIEKKRKKGKLDDGKDMDALSPHLDRKRYPYLS